MKTVLLRQRELRRRGKPDCITGQKYKFVVADNNFLVISDVDHHITILTFALFGLEGVKQNEMQSLNHKHRLTGAGSFSFCPRQDGLTPLKMEWHSTGFDFSTPDEVRREVAMAIVDGIIKYNLPDRQNPHSVYWTW